ncbi:E3 ubiquitin-protein ligase DTX3L isoform X1 [Rhinichthys klamathensis goyatoka]|uniref:E3 ubiquitin-protein ligase DTX3L isoform X1 n=2 Tax=Rhinichthys klamathensis goyatoka TaxID=3034132 RepID=UPI0024B4E43F|nr:E3 ubiquitin-protein ligase DTX3L isoform X1 [Rhinichthys klamathensis goyatoka]
MASPQKIFTEVRLKIDPATIPPNSVSSILHGKTVTLRSDGGYTVATGSFQDIEDIHRKCITTRPTYDGSSNLRQEEMRLRGHTAAGLGQAQSYSLVVQPVQVDEVIMHYIQEKKSKELHIIENRNGVSINQSTSHVTFTSKTGKNIQAQFAREQFITLYQKTATGLQTRTYVYSPNIIALCSAEFPELLINSDQKRLELTGSFIILERLDTFLNGSAQHRMGTIYPQHQTPRKTKDDDIPYKQPVTQEKSTDPAKDEKCPICLDSIKTPDCTVLSKCKHKFCKDCLARAFQLKPACPICGEIYGDLTGTQPKVGTMTVSRDSSSLPGYRKYGTIVITYHIPSGRQGNEHPNPGMEYMGASRIAYLPDSTEGNNVLKLLRRAFDQRLTFTIGCSSTTGKNNVVTWNDIHHKTSRDGGPTHYGYPDPDYLKRVQDELKAKGIY